MRMDEFTRQVDTGDVLLFEGRAWYSWIIKLRTLSRYSHAAIVVKLRLEGMAYHNLYVLESLEPHGVRLYPLGKYFGDCLADGTTVHWFAIADRKIDRQTVALWALNQLGRRYVSLWQMALSFGAIVRAVRRRLGWHTDVELDPERFFCSELVASALAFGGCSSDPESKLQPVTTDPGSIAELPCLRPMGVIQLAATRPGRDAMSCPLAGPRSAPSTPRRG